jgi:hypothetical protein
LGAPNGRVQFRPNWLIANWNNLLICGLVYSSGRPATYLPQEKIPLKNSIANNSHIFTIYRAAYLRQVKIPLKIALPIRLAS